MNAAEPFADGREHLAAELSWLELALRTLVNSARTEGGHRWFVSPEEAARLLSGAALTEPPPELGLARRRIQARLAASRELPLPRLSSLFALTPEEELLVVACAAADLEARYGKVYGYLHDDMTRQRPSRHLVEALAGLNEPGDTGRTLLDPQAAVFRWRLVEPLGGAAHQHAPGMVLDPGILALLLNHDRHDAKIDDALRPVPDGDPEAWPYQNTVDRLATLLHDGRRPVAAHFHGRLAAEGRRVVAAACRRLGAGLLHADLGELLAKSQSGELPLAVGLRLVYRRAVLAGAGIYLSGMDALLRDARSAAHVRVLEELLPDAPWITCTEGERLWVPERVAFLPFEPAALSHRERRAAWRRAVPGLAQEQVDALAARFPSAPSEVFDAVRLARGRATAAGDGEPAQLAFEELSWACRAPQRAALDGLARPIHPRAGWADLILPPDVVEQLKELCAQVRHLGRVLEEWALGQRASSGHGVQALFLGPSGTGKTLAAEVVAAAVGMDLVRVDLSTVVSKYIGETEKHLNRVFAAAERSGSILFFDEADALFGKRSEVGDAHDRYANIEVGYLLQRIEEYTGVVVLATNLAQNIDDAFQRRLRVKITFPFPDEVARLAIWRRHLPAELPLSGDLDLARMARRFKISGGTIRKIVWNAAFLAADDGGRMDADHLLLATRREYERMGKPFVALEVTR
ncbi:ATP-binding protein [Nonomuraea endophytica]|uniref:ATP-binding protein n=1 Tax=Nonomuraea endophytica TaxID=714136 RepID=UPI0037C8DB77